jgi:hypothetical protein
MTLIIDKMDSAKNRIPFFARAPKDVDGDMQNAFLVHIVGVIIHGRPDSRYFFAASQQLAGDSNLNLECLRRALFMKADGKPLRRKIFLQFDNASVSDSVVHSMYHITTCTTLCIVNCSCAVKYSML